MSLCPRMMCVACIHVRRTLIDDYASIDVSTFATTFLRDTRFVAFSLRARYFASKRERTIIISSCVNVHALFFACCIDVANSRRNTTRICFVVNVRDLSSRIMSFNIVFKTISRTTIFDAFDLRVMSLCPIIQLIA